MSELVTLQRKFTQLDNDVSAIYSMLANIEGTQRRHGSRIEAIDNRLDGIDNRLGSIDNRLGSIDSRFDGTDSRLDGTDNRLDGMDQKLETILELLRSR